MWRYSSHRSLRNQYEPIANHGHLAHTSIKYDEGKSCFLFYILLRRLSERLPTVLDLGDIFLLLDKTGVRAYDADIGGKFALKKRVWALSDSNSITEWSCRAFLWSGNKRDALIVQTTFLEKKRWYQWAKERSASHFVMDCFTFDEMRALRLGHRRGRSIRSDLFFSQSIILGLDVERFLRNFKKWGPNARIELTRKRRGARALATASEESARIFALDPFRFAVAEDKPSRRADHALFTVRPSDPNWMVESKPITSTVSSQRPSPGSVLLNELVSTT